MGYESSTKSPIFVTTVENWISETGEILALIRYSHAGGSKSFEFLTSHDGFREVIAQLPSKAYITVFHRKQLPLRGSIDENFIAAAIALVPDGQEYLIAGLDRIHCGPASWIPNWTGETRAEMKEDLREHLGIRVACGPYPPFWLHDNEDVISAVVPETDGSIVCGVY